MTKTEALRDMLTAWLLEFGDTPVTGGAYADKAWYDQYRVDLESATGSLPPGDQLVQVRGGWVMSQRGIDFIKGGDS